MIAALGPMERDGSRRVACGYCTATLYAELVDERLWKPCDEGDHVCGVCDEIICARCWKNKEKHGSDEDCFAECVRIMQRTEQQRARLRESNGYESLR